ncbi:MAG: signal peptide peptidase SppA [Planctomycetes bacterium]|nr:signal peptide peptidase SppA [Planctomycetota bacterium]
MLSFGKIVSNRAIFTVCMTITCVGCLPDSFVVTPISVQPKLKERVLYSDSTFPNGKIAIIEVDGVIANTRQGGFLSTGEHPVAKLTEQLDIARRDKSVKAVVLRINSPGGTVTASELMHHEIKRLRNSGKPVVAMMMDVAASGGYYIACAADEIMACNSTVTGSIGVVMQTMEVTGTMELIGVQAHTIKSGKQKAAGSPFEKLQPEQRAVFQGVIDELYDQFVNVVAEGRPALSREQVIPLADGRVYTSKQALDLKLIDRIGTIEDAIELAKEKAGIKNAKVVAYRRPFLRASNYYARHDPSIKDINLLNVDLGLSGNSYGAPFMYLWIH